MGAQTTAEAALSEEWLGRTDATLAFYRKLRDAFAPGKPLWLTETADAACGGNPWARTFLDTFRYLDQLGRLAKQGVEVVAHNTLVASDYGLLDDVTLTPKPNYWGALLWRKLMDTGVLESGVPIQSGLHLYAHCLRGTPGGVALLAINNDRAAPRTLTVPLPGERYTLSSDDLQGKTVRLNGVALELGADDVLPDPTGVPRSRDSFRWRRPRSRSSPCPQPETAPAGSARACGGNRSKRAGPLGSESDSCCRVSRAQRSASSRCAADPGPPNTLRLWRSGSAVQHFVLHRVRDPQVGDMQYGVRRTQDTSELRHGLAT